MAKKWKAGDYIPIDYINALEIEVEKLREAVKKGVTSDKSRHCTKKSDA